jgi:hypothetical protein
VHTARLLCKILTAAEACCSSNAISFNTTLSPHLHRRSLCVGVHGAADHVPMLTAAYDQSFLMRQSVRHTGRELGSAEKMGRW